LEFIKCLQITISLKTRIFSLFKIYITSLSRSVWSSNRYFSLSKS
jgi:hypothetical protein